MALKLLVGTGKSEEEEKMRGEHHCITLFIVLEESIGITLKTPCGYRVDPSMFILVLLFSYLVAFHGY